MDTIKAPARRKIINHACLVVVAQHKNKEETRSERKGERKTSAHTRVVYNSRGYKAAGKGAREASAQKCKRG